MRVLLGAPLLAALLCGVSSAQSGGGTLQVPGFSDSGDSLTSMTSGASSKPASVSVAQPSYDFGVVFQGAQVKHTFELINKGPGTLTIGSVQTSCGCTVAQPTRHQVQPGESSDIAAVFETSSDKGPAQRMITVHTNDPQHKEVILTIKGDVKVKVDAAPVPLVFTGVKHGTEATRDILVTDMVNRAPFKINSISSSNPNLRVEERPRTDGKPGAILRVTLLKSAPAGPFADQIRVATSESPLNLPVFATIVGDINVNPAQVSFGIVKDKASVVRYARLTNVADHPVKVLAVTTNNPRVSASAQPITPGKEYKLVVELQRDAPRGTLRGAVAIKTDDPGQPLVELPFYGIVGSFSG